MTLRCLEAVFKGELDHTRLAAVAHGLHDHCHRSNLERLSAGEHELVRSKHGFERVGEEAAARPDFERVLVNALDPKRRLTRIQWQQVGRIALVRFASRPRGHS